MIVNNYFALFFCIGAIMLLLLTVASFIVLYFFSNNKMYKYISDFIEKAMIFLLLFLGLCFYISLFFIKK